MRRLVRKVLRSVAAYDPTYYDMHEDQNERFFAQLYLERIVAHADAAGIRPPATVLEAGCQAGRLVMPLARAGFQVTGIDTSGFALRRAKRHARTAGVRAAFMRGDLRALLGRRPEWQFDLVICAEVLYLRPEFRDMLQVLARAVKPGGLLCVSHRPKMYYLIEALKRYDMETAKHVLDHSEGAFRDSAYYNWQTPEELRTLYDAVGVRWLAAYPIDQLSWLANLSPVKLDEGQRATLLSLETSHVSGAPWCSRYVLVVAERPHAQEACRG